MSQSAIENELRDLILQVLEENKKEIIDKGARIEVEVLWEEIKTLRRQLKELKAKVAGEHEYE